MVVLAFQPDAPAPGVLNGYLQYIGQVDLSFTDSAEIDIGQIVFDELNTLPVADVLPTGYVYSWKMLLSLPEGASDLLTSFSSLPPRFKFGHLTASSNSGVVWNDVLTFEDQVTPNFRGSFNTENPNPGDGFPFGTIPLGSSLISTWRQIGVWPNVATFTEARATFAGIFLFKPTPYIARIAYSVYESFTAYDILASAPRPFVVTYP